MDLTDNLLAYFLCMLFSLCITTYPKKGGLPFILLEASKLKLMILFFLTKLLSVGLLNSDNTFYISCKVLIANGLVLLCIIWNITSVLTVVFCKLQLERSVVYSVHQTTLWPPPFLFIWDQPRVLHECGKLRRLMAGPRRLHLSTVES